MKLFDDAMSDTVTPVLKFGYYCGSLRGLVVVLGHFQQGMCPLEEI
jgi:hypothetical protein